MELPLKAENFIRPVDGGYVSSGFWGARKHTGIDIAAPKGTPIKASVAGRVSLVKYENNGYGYYLKIDHGMVWKHFMPTTAKC